MYCLADFGESLLPVFLRCNKMCRVAIDYGRECSTVILNPSLNIIVVIPLPKNFTSRSDSTAFKRLGSLLGYQTPWRHARRRWSGLQ